MLKNVLILLFFVLFATSSYSAGSDPKPAKVKTDYAKAVEAIKFAKKYEKKGKLEKAKKRYEKAQKHLKEYFPKYSIHLDFQMYKCLQIAQLMQQIPWALLLLGFLNVELAYSHLSHQEKACQQ